MPHLSRPGEGRADRVPPARPQPAPHPALTANLDPRAVPAGVLPPEAILALQRTVGNRAVQEMLLVQRGRTKHAHAKLKKETKRRQWKKTRPWPEEQLKGRILEVTDKYLFRKKLQTGYVDMNKVAANFPAIDGIADGKFRQVKAYLHLGRQNRLTRVPTVRRIVAQVEVLSEKCEVAAQRLVDHNGRLLVQLLDINAGRSGTKGRVGLAPYNVADTSPGARVKHKAVLPEEFRKLAKAQVAGHQADPQKFEFDPDELALAMMDSMVVVVPDDLVADVQRQVTGVTVEGGGFTSTQIKDIMDVRGYTARTRRSDDEKDTDFSG